MKTGDTFKVKGQRGKFKVAKIVEQRNGRDAIYATSTKSGSFRFFYADDERIREVENA